MTYHRPEFRHPDLPTNELGYTKKQYEGAISTLCAGCGHDSISAGVIQGYTMLPAWLMSFCMTSAIIGKNSLSVCRK